MSEWEDESSEDWEEEAEDIGCDYGVSEFCSDPQTKEMNLCTTECRAYLDSVAAETNKIIREQGEKEK